MLFAGPTSSTLDTAPADGVRDAVDKDKDAHGANKMSDESATCVPDVSAGASKSKNDSAQSIEHTSSAESFIPPVTAPSASRDEPAEGAPAESVTAEQQLSAHEPLGSQTRSVGGDTTVVVTTSSDVPNSATANNGDHIVQACDNSVLDAEKTAVEPESEKAMVQDASEQAKQSGAGCLSLPHALTEASHMSAVDVGCQPALASSSMAGNLSSFLTVPSSAPKDTPEGADPAHAVCVDDEDEFEGQREEISERSDDESEVGKGEQAGQVPLSDMTIYPVEFKCPDSDRRTMMKVQEQVWSAVTARTHVSCALQVRLIFVEAFQMCLTCLCVCSEISKNFP